MDHTASVILLDRDGRFVGTIAYGEDPKAARAKLERLTERT
jgi:protein SCO1